MVVQFSDRPGGFDSVILKAHTQRETGGRSIVLHRCVQLWRTPCRVSLTSSRFITWRKEGRKWRLTYQIAWHRWLHLYTTHRSFSWFAGESLEASSDNDTPNWIAKNRCCRSSMGGVGRWKLSSERANSPTGLWCDL